MPPIPPLTRLLGFAGLLPFLAAALGAWAGPEAWRGAALWALAAYGAVILSFLGAVHWGFGLGGSGPGGVGPGGVGPGGLGPSGLGSAGLDLSGAAPAAPAATAWRLGLGVLPALLGWVALLLPAGPGLALLAAGILGTAAVETLAARRGLLPDGYLRLRWWLSLGGAACLLAGAAAVR